ncbi:hypothetical protein C2845_PM05G34790 [Panicum miliaceum]|uniref:Uncharacterized protein n=1 Tax=Panicum miliaceum TaxID=4540 RepID=A0A3L6SXF2_PANMI|nr:hypothetical protein C2845_PM05G34790 [Panicum miliaceum]
MDRSLMAGVVTDDVYDDNVVFGQSLAHRQWLVPYINDEVLKAYSFLALPGRPSIHPRHHYGRCYFGPHGAFFSSRYFPAILTPDVLAAGVNILGGIPYQGGDGPVHFGIMSGISMAVHT